MCLVLLLYFYAFLHLVYLFITDVQHFVSAVAGVKALYEVDGDDDNDDDDDDDVPIIVLIYVNSVTQG